MWNGVHKQLPYWWRNMTENADLTEMKSSILECCTHILNITI